MRLSTPFKFQRFFYLGLDTKAGIGDEMVGAGLGRFYVGIYPTRRGFDLSAGITDHNGCL